MKYLLPYYIAHNFPTERLPFLPFLIWHLFYQSLACILRAVFPLQGAEILRHIYQQPPELILPTSWAKGHSPTATRVQVSGRGAGRAGHWWWGAPCVTPRHPGRASGLLGEHRTHQNQVVALEIAKWGLGGNFVTFNNTCGVGPRTEGQTYGLKDRTTTRPNTFGAAAPLMTRQCFPWAPKCWCCGAGDTNSLLH